MRKNKFFATLMAALTVVSLAACGTKEVSVSSETSTETTVSATEVAEPVAPVAEEKEASVDFEDGSFDFIKTYLKHATSDESVLSIADFNGSKAVKVETVNPAKFPWVAIDVYALLGDKASEVATVEAQLGALGTDGKFYAVSGGEYAWADGEITDSLGDWSVFLASKNPKYATIDLAGKGITLDAENNVVIFSVATEVSKDVKEGGNGECSVLYVDNLRFLDASGNLIKPTSTAVAFAAPAGFENTEEDRSNMVAVANAVEFEGFAKSAGAWTQDGLEMPQEIIDALVPGSVVEISYSSEDGSMWIVMPDAAAGWSRIADNGGAYINNSKTTAQIDYEQLVAVLGEDKSTWGARMQCEAASAWEVYSVKVGQASVAKEFSGVEFPEFAKSAGAWTQDGLEMPQEIIDALVPGSVVKINYASEDGSMWIVMPDAAAGWSRVGDNGGAECDGSVCYVTYEQIVAICGEDKSTWGARMQCEASSAWEVYSVEVGALKEKAGGIFTEDVAFEGFAKSAGAWTQDGLEMPQEIIDALVPGSVVKINYASEDDSMWIVMPDATVGWSRVADNGGAECDGSVCYVTYDQIVAVCGEDKSAWGARMQCEASSAWEVYSVSVGHYADVPRLHNMVEFPEFAKSAGAWTQDGLEMPQEIIDALVPGAVVKINYTSEDGSMWIVMPDAAAGWSRVADNGASVCVDGVCYVTYEQIATVCGEDKSAWGARMQCEAASAWEVYSVSVGLK